jgi:hypothetical protein
MKVYRVINDVNHYQFFLPEKTEDWPKLEMDCTSRSSTWQPPSVYVFNPTLQRGDFYQFGGGVLIANSRSTDVLREFFEMAGELLPLSYNDDMYTALNVTECVNCLDSERSEWVIGVSTNSKLYPKKYAFHRKRFAESPLFKIPETCRGEILLAEGLRDPQREFRHVVNRAKLRGLVFEKLWDTDD